MDVLKALVARVARAFYEPKYIVILDELNNAPPNSNGVREEDLVMALKMAPRDVHRICGKLKQDRLLKMATRMEARKQDQRPVPKTYYYLDYKEFVDVVKWKMYKMQTIVRDNLRTQSENKGYICPNCSRKFTPLDAIALSGGDGLFHCDMCSSVLEENDNAENVQDSQQVLTRLQEQSQPIISLLKQTDSLVIPASYIFKPSAASKGTNGHARDDHELAIAQDTGAGQGEIIVDLQMDNEAARRQKQQEAEEKRQQNMLPVWHQRSTVSDALASTSEVVEEKKNEDEDEMFEEVAQEEFDADRHDYYAKYYESLSQAAPAALDASDAEEEPEFETVENTEGSNMLEERMDGEEEEFEDVPLVSVNGRMVPLNEIMEEDQRNMTTEEYRAYYEAWQSWQSS
ncbi:hypothetical protein O0I10_007747 [Lichtheimia ornata]|uniref:HTH TFE/IIEalpha-type domain-containing protein n=1 Tax=Lichtheimia ornata TaxID=688661 RepID=A0AAD7V0Z5_9FUNG|nr:uncharacterized protein O0I10_007747 [Lichtheimia ornata]KAJ8656668.1 hypothetical protein O0I10_007747 [Lichtheimia ornata]